MVIAIDASRAVNESAGIGRYTKELVERLLKTEKDHKFILIFTYWRADEDKEKRIKSYGQANVTIRTAKIPGTLKETLWRGKSRLYNGLYQGADVLLAPSFLEYKNGLKLPQVTIIHDMTTFLFPDQRGKEVSTRLSNQTSTAIKGSKRIIAISKNTKKDIIEVCKVESQSSTGSDCPERESNGQKLKVIYPGLTSFNKVSPNLPKGLLAKKYILFTGTIEPRKNLKNLIAAYDLLPIKLQHKYPLVVTGSIGWNTSNVEKDEKIKYLGRVSDEDLAKLYMEAAVFVYPSLYEGFGLPILEAMKEGTPVITSNRSSMPEAAGTAGVLINPDEPKSISGGLQAVLEGKISRCQMVKAGREQVKKFSWEKCAKEVLDVLEDI